MVGESSRVFLVAWPSCCQHNITSGFLRCFSSNIGIQILDIKTKRPPVAATLTRLMLELDYKADVLLIYRIILTTNPNHACDDNTFAGISVE